jgi:hypothetical protein
MEPITSNTTRKGKLVLFIIIFILLILGIKSLFKKDVYVGFFYPDANNLMVDIQSDTTFDSLEACRDWVDEQVSSRGSSETRHDYECGKNCDMSKGKPFVCEETLE